MTTRYLAGFDLSDVGAWTLTVDDNGGGSPTEYDEDDLSSTLAAHIAIASTPAYSSLTSMLNTALSSEPVSVSFSTATYRYTITYTGGGSGFDLTFSQAAADSMGFSTLVHTNQTSITSDQVPYYLIETQVDGRSAYSRDFEPDGIASQAISDDGTSIFGLARTASPKFLDWRQQFETLESTFKAEATTVPWTWEHFFEHARTVHPIQVVDGYDDMECWLRADGATFRPEPQTPDYDSQWHIPFRVVLIGRI